MQGLELLSEKEPEQVSELLSVQVRLSEQESEMEGEIQQKFLVDSMLLMLHGFYPE